MSRLPRPPRGVRDIPSGVEKVPMQEFVGYRTGLAATLGCAVLTSVAAAGPWPTSQSRGTAPAVTGLAPGLALTPNHVSPGHFGSFGLRSSGSLEQVALTLSTSRRIAVPPHRPEVPVVRLSPFDQITRRAPETGTPIFGGEVPPIVLASSGGGDADGSILIAVSGGLDTGIFDTPFVLDIPEEDESNSVVVVPLPTPALLGLAGIAAAFALRRLTLARR